MYRVGVSGFRGFSDDALGLGLPRTWNARRSKVLSSKATCRRSGSGQADDWGRPAILVARYATIVESPEVVICRIRCE